MGEILDLDEISQEKIEKYCIINIEKTVRKVNENEL